MLEVFGTLYLTEGVSEQLAIDRAQRIFSCLDTNNDGEITEEEFVTGCLQVKLTPPPNVTFFNSPYTFHTLNKLSPPADGSLNKCPNCNFLSRQLV